MATKLLGPAPSGPDDAVDKGYVDGRTPGDGGSGAVYGLPGVGFITRVDNSHPMLTVNLYPIQFSAPFTITGIVTDFFNVTGTGGSLRVALYNYVSLQDVGSLYSNIGSLPVSASSKVTSTGLSVSGPAGRYWLAWSMDNNSGALTAASTRHFVAPIYVVGSNSFQETRIPQSTLASGASWPSDLAETLVNTSVTSASATAGIRIPVAIQWTEP